MYSSGLSIVIFLAVRVFFSLVLLLLLLLLSLPNTATYELINASMQASMQCQTILNMQRTMMIDEGMIDQVNTRAPKSSEASIINLQQKITTEVSRKVSKQQQSKRLCVADNCRYVPFQRNGHLKSFEKPVHQCCYHSKTVAVTLQNG